MGVIDVGRRDRYLETRHLDWGVFRVAIRRQISLSIVTWTGVEAARCAAKHAEASHRRGESDRKRIAAQRDFRLLRRVVMLGAVAGEKW